MYCGIDLERTRNLDRANYSECFLPSRQPKLHDKLGFMALMPAYSNIGKPELLPILPYRLLLRTHGLLFSFSSKSKLCRRKKNKVLKGRKKV